MKRLASVLALLVALMCLAMPALAHGGRTDSNGGHYNRATGEYHYHHGYPAHQHPGGECPYDYRDNTDHRSSNSSTSSKPTSSHKPASLSSPQKINPIDGWLGDAIFVVLALGFVFFFHYIPYLLQAHNIGRRRLIVALIGASIDLIGLITLFFLR